MAKKLISKLRGKYEESLQSAELDAKINSVTDTVDLPTRFAMLGDLTSTLTKTHTKAELKRTMPRIQERYITVVAELKSSPTGGMSTEFATVCTDEKLGTMPLT